MHAVVRQYSGQGASQTFDDLQENLGEIERLIKGVPGFVSYTLLRTLDGGISVTVCEDKAGTDESVRVAADFISANVSAPISPPEVSEGEAMLHLS